MEEPTTRRREEELKHVHLDCPGPILPATLLSAYDCTPCVLHFKQLHASAVVDAVGGEGGGEALFTVRGAHFSPLRFIDMDALVHLSVGNGLQAAVLPPANLPWLYTGDGALRTYSAVPDAWGDGYLDEYPMLSNTTTYHASLQAGESLLIPAGWFFQVKTNAGCQFTQFQSLPRANAKFRPTLMHQRASKGAYCAMLLERGVGVPTQGSDTTTSTPAGASSKRRREDDDNEATREGSPLSEAIEGRKRTCQWREQGWSRDLELTCDWFSHNISAWEHVFKGLDWLEPASCCSQTGLVSEQKRGRTVLEIGVWEGNSAAWLLQHVVGSGVLLCVDSFRGGEEHQARGQDLAYVEANFRENMQSALAALQPTSAQVILLKGTASQVLPSLLCGHGKWERLRGEKGKWEAVDARDATASMKCNGSEASDCSAANSSPWPSNAVELDAVYIDGSHRAEDVLLDAVLAWAALRRGGVMIFDDYQWHAESCPHYDRGFGGSLRERVGPADSQAADKPAAAGGQEQAAWEGEERLRDSRCFCPGKAADAFMRVYNRHAEVLHAGYQLIVRKRESESASG